MSRLARRATLVVSVLLITASPFVAAQSALRVGAEFQVNTYTPSVQTHAAVAREAEGDFVVVWTQVVGLDNDVVGRRFDSLGVTQGAVFRVNSYTTHDQLFPDVAMDGAGRFVVSWSATYMAYGFVDIFVRRFDAQGVAQGVEMQANSFTTGNQNQARVARAAGGSFVVVWQGDQQDGSEYGVFGRRFDSSGAAQGGEFLVNSSTVGSQLQPSVAIESDGDFIVAWTTDASGSNVHARRFSSTGVAGAEFPVTTSTGVGLPSVSFAGDGDFVVAWWDGQARDGSGGGIFARRFNALGGAEAVEFQVNSYTSLSQISPKVKMDPAGSFVVAWDSNLQDGSDYGVFARTFDANGVARSAELQINSYTNNPQGGANVAVDGDGDFVVVWNSTGQDGSDSGVFAQRYVTLAVLDVDGNGAFTALTDGLLILRFAFGFTGPTLTNGALGSGCTRCDGATIVAYLQTLV